MNASKYKMSKDLVHLILIYFKQNFLASSRKPSSFYLKLKKWYVRYRDRMRWERYKKFKRMNEKYILTPVKYLGFLSTLKIH